MWWNRHVVRRTVFTIAILATACASPPSPPPIAWGELPAVIDGPGGEAWLTRSPDGLVIVFGRHDESWQNHRMYLTRLINGAWTEPAQVPWTHDIDAAAVHFAPDGRSLLFASSRGPSGEERPRGQREDNIWRVSWDGEHWGEPQILPPPINSPADELDAVEVNGGVIYFTSMREGSTGTYTGRNPYNKAPPDMYRAVPDGSGGYNIEPLVDLNTDHTESTLFVTPDESLIVFHRADDPVGLGKDDLFAARRQGRGWGPATHLGANTNSAEYEYGPEISHDGSTLYFTTHRAGQAGLMAVNLRQTMRQ